MTPSVIAHYRITAKLGEGGMGEVWRAVDTKLGREVAIKILPDSFAQDPDRLARFTREAHVLASLNHPNIAAIYGVEDQALVMELVEGPTLTERIAQGPMPLAEALPIARQIAEALEYAHERGVVHRDLKPANIKVTPEGRVKVLDFGLAKAMTSEAPAAGQAASPMSSPTVTIRAGASVVGTILGTAAYMSPEQARGQVVDKRSDIWSFGVVLFEMLTGRHAFKGETISDTLAAVLKTDPDWANLPADTPASVRALLRRCLERDRKKRLRDIGDAFLGEVEQPRVLSGPPAEERRPRLLYWVAAAATASTLALLLLARIHLREQPQPGVQLSLAPPEKTVFTHVQAQAGGFAISPDGRALAFVATQEGRTLLWVQRLDSSTAHPLAGTENAYYPFWSPDNRFLGFFAGNQLKKIEVAGGPPQVICDVALSRGGSWNQEGTIVFSGIDRTVYRVPAAGGQPAKLTTLDPAYQENAHYWPEFLPDGRHFLYFVRSGLRGANAICVGSVDGQPGTGRRIEVVKAATNAKYVPPPDGAIWRSAGWLLFLRETTLFAQRFDAARLALDGEPVPVAERVGYEPSIAFADFSTSRDGVLVYSHGGSQYARLTWMGRDGKQSPAVAHAGYYLGPRLSPDATMAAATMAEPQTGNLDIWQIDLLHDISTRCTFDPAADIMPIWSPDGKQIAFSSRREGLSRLYIKTASGTANEELIASPSGQSQTQYLCDWSRDGRSILYEEAGGATGFDLWVLPMIGGASEARKPIPFLQTAFNETQGQFSPDGRWIAYTSDESGRNEVYVRSFPGASSKFQISNNGGSEPRWRRDGKEMYYLATDGKLMAATVKSTAATFEREPPKPLFEAHWPSGSGIYFTYDLTSDGQRFLGAVLAEAETTRNLTVVTNWQAGLKQ
jgi:Tol biopolymer transport system component